MSMAVPLSLWTMVTWFVYQVGITPGRLSSKVLLAKRTPTLAPPPHILPPFPMFMWVLIPLHLWVVPKARAGAAVRVSMAATSLLCLATGLASQLGALTFLTHAQTTCKPQPDSTVNCSFHQTIKKNVLTQKWPSKGDDRECWRVWEVLASENDLEPQETDPWSVKHLWSHN